MKALVLAAGKGERLQPLTENRPKHMLPIAGQPLLHHLLDSTRAAGIADVVLLVGHKREEINLYFEDGARFGVNLSYVVQPRIAGTAWAVRDCEPFLHGEDFLLVYGDLYLGPDTLRNFVKGTSADRLAMATVRVADSSQYGVVESEGGYVTQIHEKPRAKTGGGHVFAGIARLGPVVFDMIRRTRRSKRGEYELTTALQELVSRGEKVRVHEIPSSSWMDVGRPWDLLEANKRALEGLNGRVEGTIQSNVTLDGKVVVERGVIVYSGSRIQGPAHIGPGARVGPNSRIRAHTTVGAECVIGASCDIKNSIIMKETEIPHLSYVGDSIVGERCNLGAGTITANLRFDDQPIRVRIKNSMESSRQRKLGAIIGDDVKTGINVTMFPGVKIGSGSWIEPGCIVRRDIPARTYVAVKQTQTLTRRRRV